MSESDNEATGRAIGMGLTFFVATIWVVYGLTNAPTWLLVVGILFSMLSGYWWAFGRRMFFPFEGRNRNRSRQGRL